MMSLKKSQNFDIAGEKGARTIATGEKVKKVATGQLV